MNNDGGIKAQYGFNFQKAVFIWYMMKRISKTNTFIYEGKEDIDLLDDGNYLISFSNKNQENIQVKSGTVTKAIWKKVVENWLILSNENMKILITENKINFNYKDSAMIKSILKDIQDGSGHKTAAIARKAHDYLKNKFDNDKKKWEQEIADIVNKAKVQEISFNQIKEEIKNAYQADYCKDIKRYDQAKKLRVERFKTECISKIDDAIDKKQPAVFKFSDFIDIESMVRESISDNKYKVDVKGLTPKKEKEAKKLIQKGEIREIDQLKYVNANESFIVKQLIRELFYRDFRNVYMGTDKEVDVHNVEIDAFANFEDTKEELEMTMDDYTPRKLFFETTKKELTSSIFTKSPIFSHGCYTYLTGENIDREYQISWKED